MGSPYITIEQAAEYLAVSVMSVQRFRKRGLLFTTHPVRTTIAWCDQYMQSQVQSFRSDPRIASARSGILHLKGRAK